MQQHRLAPELALQDEFRVVGRSGRADAHMLGDKPLEDVQDIEVEVVPAGSVVVRPAGDFLHGGERPDLPAIPLVLGLAIAEADLQFQGVPLPAPARGENAAPDPESPPFPGRLWLRGLGPSWAGAMGRGRRNGRRRFLRHCSRFRLDGHVITLMNETFWAEDRRSCPDCFQRLGPR